MVDITRLFSTVKVPNLFASGSFAADVCHADTLWQRGDRMD